MKNTPADSRPREKLLARGAAALSDAELLALLLRTGIRGKAGLPEEGPDAADAIDALVEMRREYRASKQWELADRVRNGLSALGVELKDGPTGTTWAAK